MKCFFCGDITLDDFSYNKGKFFDEELQEIINQCDVVCGNLEGAIVNTNYVSCYPKVGPYVKNCLDAAKRLKSVGFNLMALANNHIMDYGEKGLENTIECLEDNKIGYMGAGFAENEIYRIFSFFDEKENISIGILNVAGNEFGCSCDGQPGFAWVFFEKVRDIIIKGQDEYDYLVVVTHMGEENWSVPLPEVRRLYRWFIDLGASAVIAHHPHVIQGKEIYNGRNIYYSLGDFSHDWRYLLKDTYPEGLCVVLDISQNGIEANEIITYHDGFTIYIMDDLSLLYERTKLISNKEVYNKMVDELCIEYYENYYKSYYALIIGLDIKDEDEQKKYGQHRLNGEKILWDDLMLYHNVAIESHRWCVCRAIRVLGLLEEENNAF